MVERKRDQMKIEITSQKMEDQQNVEKQGTVTLQFNPKQETIDNIDT